MSESLRLFIGIELDDSIRKIVEQAHAHLKTVDTHFKWTTAQNAHITLKFLGNVSADKVDDIKSRLNKISRQTSPSQFELTEMGAFPKPQMPRIIWLGVKQEKTWMEDLAGKIDESLAEMEFQKEDRPFHPHVTIARVKTGKNRTALCEAIESFSVGQQARQSVSHFTLFQSTLTPQGPIYQNLQNFPLG